MENELDQMNKENDWLSDYLNNPPTDPDHPTWDLTKVDKKTSEDNIDVPVPKGFTPTGKEGEKKVSEGYVIKQDGTNNEFVWVPVIEGKPMFTTRTETVTENGEEKQVTVNIGQLYNFSGTGTDATSTPITTNNFANTNSWDRYREPDILTDTSYGDAVTGDDEKGISQLKSVIGITSSEEDSEAEKDEILGKWKKQLQEEFDEMKASVEKYGGFYIGRYETGNIHESKAVVQKGNSDISARNSSDIEANWYHLYQKSKTIAEGTKVKSRMIWGCQWDAVMNWFLTNDEIKGYVTNSTDKGNYKPSSSSGTRIATGSNPAYQLNNIYDMAGNVWEWTTEAENTYIRVLRGGGYDRSVSNNPVSVRNGNDPYNSYSYYGARSTLIL